MIYLIYGEDSLSVEETLASLNSVGNDDGLYDVNTTTLNGATVSLAELEAAWTTIPFLRTSALWWFEICSLAWNRGAVVAHPAQGAWMESGLTSESVSLMCLTPRN